MPPGARARARARGPQLAPWLRAWLLLALCVVPLWGQMHKVQHAPGLASQRAALVHAAPGVQAERLGCGAAEGALHRHHGPGAADADRCATLAPGVPGTLAPLSATHHLAHDSGWPGAHWASHGAVDCLVLDQLALADGLAVATVVAALDLPWPPRPAVAAPAHQPAHVAQFQARGPPVTAQA